MSHNSSYPFIRCKNILKGIPMKEYIEERAISIANYIIDSDATVLQTAKSFGVSKSIVQYGSNKMEWFLWSVQ